MGARADSLVLSKHSATGFYGVSKRISKTGKVWFEARVSGGSYGRGMHISGTFRTARHAARAVKEELDRNNSLEASEDGGQEPVETIKGDQHEEAMEREPREPREDGADKGDDDCWKRKGNNFQFDIEFVRYAMGFQNGVKIQIPLNALTGNWSSQVYGETVECTILGGCEEENYVAVAREDKYDCTIYLTSATLMHKNTRAPWRPLPMDVVVRSRKQFNEPENRVSRERAACFFRGVVKASSGSLNPEDVIITLDGNTTNRRAMEVESSFLPANQRPTLITAEMDADVALAQHLIIGNVCFTGANPNARNRSLLSGRSKGEKLEHLIQKASSVSDGDIVALQRVVGMYLDYCGGPVGSMQRDKCAKNMKLNVVARLTRLRVLAVTISKRRHCDLSNTFEEFVEIPYGFALDQIFTDNARVECRLFKRDCNVPRRLAVPGDWWHGCPKDFKRKLYECVVVDHDRDSDTYQICCPEDGDQKLYAMRGDAVIRYAIADDLDFEAFARSKQLGRPCKVNCAEGEKENARGPKWVSVAKAKAKKPSSFGSAFVGACGKCNAVDPKTAGLSGRSFGRCCELRNGHIGPHSWEIV